MNRQIKFRAWQINWKNNVTGKEQGRMIQWEDIQDDFAIILKMTSYYIPMQYTGLKDKNGKEIYQGDVLTPAEELIGGGIENQIVEWSPMGFWKGFVNYASSEIIGNIYENPELLK